MAAVELGAKVAPVRRVALPTARLLLQVADLLLQRDDVRALEPVEHADRQLEPRALVAQVVAEIEPVGSVGRGQEIAVLEQDRLPSLV